MMKRLDPLYLHGQVISWFNVLNYTLNLFKVAYRLEGVLQIKMQNIGCNVVQTRSETSSRNH